MPPRSDALSEFDVLSEEDRCTLLALARQAVFETICRRRIPQPPPAAGRLAKPAGAFVTLSCDGKLRGCVGRTDATLALAETVVQCAITAASRDPRFRPLGADELTRLGIEISVLSELWPVRQEEFEPGIHGIILTRGGQRALLLPQVAVEHNWSAIQFLQAVSRKAGLEPDAWRDPQTTLLAFTADVFSDVDVFAQEERRRA